MSQITSGIRSILSNPYFYEFFHKITNVHYYKTSTFYNVINKNKKKKIKVLDIGCGPAEILRYLDNKVEYYGIDYAKKRFNKRGVFIKSIYTRKLSLKLPKFDYVIMSGFLHHLNDSQVKKILSNIKLNIHHSSKVLSLDPVYIKNQNKIAKMIIDLDRGNNVRNVANISKLIKDYSIKKKIIFQKYIPYTWLYLELKLKK